MDVDTVLKELNGFKLIIEEAKQDKGEAKGALSEQMKALKSYDIDSVKEAKKIIKDNKKRLPVLLEKLTTDFEELKSGYEW
jgi:hypothetical protein